MRRGLRIGLASAALLLLALPAGADDPAGRQKNRRVEVTLDTCS